MEIIFLLFSKKRSLLAESEARANADNSLLCCKAWEAEQREEGEAYGPDCIRKKGVCSSYVMPGSSKIFWHVSATPPVNCLLSEEEGRTNNSVERL